MKLRPAYEKGNPNGELGSVRARLHDGVTHFEADTICGRLGWKVFWDLDFVDRDTGDPTCTKCLAVLAEEGS